jgi:hypothetical protein
VNPNGATTASAVNVSGTGRTKFSALRGKRYHGFVSKQDDSAFTDRAVLSISSTTASPNTRPKTARRPPQRPRKRMSRRQYVRLPDDFRSFPAGIAARARPGGLTGPEPNATPGPHEELVSVP